MRVQGVLMTLLCVCRRCASGGGSLKVAASTGIVNEQVRLLLPNLAALVQSIHAVWLPTVQAGVSPDWQQLYRSVEYEHTVDPEFRLNTEGDTQVRHLQCFFARFEFPCRLLCMLGCLVICSCFIVASDESTRQTLNFCNTHRLTLWYERLYSFCGVESLFVLDQGCMSYGPDTRGARHAISLNILLAMRVGWGLASAA